MKNYSSQKRQRENIQDAKRYAEVEVQRREGK